jgi:hypothetical protein
MKQKSNIAGILSIDIYRTVGDTPGLKTGGKPVVHSRYMQSGLSA